MKKTILLFSIFLLAGTTVCAKDSDNSSKGKNAGAKSVVVKAGDYDKAVCKDLKNDSTYNKRAKCVKSVCNKACAKINKKWNGNHETQYPWKGGDTRITCYYNE